MRYTPKGNKTLSCAITGALLASALVFALFSTLEQGIFLKNILHLLTVLSFMSAVLFVSRYLSFEYVYECSDFEFLIYKTTKRTKKIVCRLYYSDITSFDKTKALSLDKNDRPDMKHDYTMTFFGKNTYTLVYELDEKTGVLIIEPDDKFVSILEKYTKNDIILP